MLRIINFFKTQLSRIFRKKKPQHTQSSFFPIHSLEGKSNFKRYFRIERDGSSIERVFLNVSDISLREELIANHYLQFHARNYKENTVGVRVVSRDAPWDFGIYLSDGSQFNIEITSIADNSWLFEKLKREERFEEIHLYGIDMTHETEWGYQRPNTEFFLGVAVGKGIKIHIPEESALLSPLWLYGYEDKPSSPFEMVKEGLQIREKELTGILSQKEEAWIQALCEKVGHECAMQELHHVIGYINQLLRGRKK